MKLCRTISIDELENDQKIRITSVLKPRSSPPNPSPTQTSVSAFGHRHVGISAPSQEESDWGACVIETANKTRRLHRSAAETRPLELRGFQLGVPQPSKTRPLRSTADRGAQEAQKSLLPRGPEQLRAIGRTSRHHETKDNTRSEPIGSVSLAFIVHYEDVGITVLKRQSD